MRLTQVSIVGTWQILNHHHKTHSAPFLVCPSRWLAEQKKGTFREPSKTNSQEECCLRRMQFENRPVWEKNTTLKRTLLEKSPASRKTPWPGFEKGSASWRVHCFLKKKNTLRRSILHEGHRFQENPVSRGNPPKEGPCFKKNPHYQKNPTFWRNPVLRTA